MPVVYDAGAPAGKSTWTRSRQRAILSSPISNTNDEATLLAPHRDSYAAAPAVAPRRVIDLRSQQANTSVGTDTASLRYRGENRASRSAIRCFDLVVASGALLLAAPLFAIVAALVKLTSSGPVFYRSERLASEQSTFLALKFRSMHRDADDRLAELLAGDDTARSEYDLHRKLADDPRITRLGRMLRITSIDELPQLINILNGEMSVVGPRPKLPNEREFYGAELPLVLSAKPGLTGLWQVSGRSKLTMQERVALDVQYVNERSFRGDLKICAITAGQLARPRRHGAT